MIFLKAPQPGTVKTRLAATIGAERACAVYRRMAEMQVAEAKRFTDSVGIHFAPRSAEVEMRNWLGATLEYFTQSDGGLGARMVQAVADAFRRGAQRVALLGGDCPALDADRLAMAFCPFTTRCGTGARRCGVWPDVGRGLLSACPIAPGAGALLQHSLEHSDHALGL